MNSAAGRIRSMTPMPWPEPQMSRHALDLREPSEPNFIAVGSAGGEIVGIESGIHDRRAQIIAVNAGEEVGIDDVGGTALDDRLLVASGAFASSVAMKGEPT